MNLDELREWVSYDEATGQFTWLKTSGKGYAGSIAGTLMLKGYVLICIRGNPILAHRLAWLFVHGEFPKRQLDHINGDPADNRIQNLRLASNMQNHANRPPQRNNTSGVKGVYWFKPQRKWKAQIVVGGKSMTLGYFDNKDDAIAARVQADKKYQGAFAWPLSVLG